MWQVTSSRIAYENPWIQVVEDQVIGPDGAQGLYGVVEVRNPAVFIVAVNDAGAEGISDVRWVPWPEVLRMVKTGEITDGESVAALLYAAIALGKIA